MTDEEMAEKYVDALLNKDDDEINKFLDENLGDLQLNERQAGTILGIIKGIGICSFLAGLKAGKPKWHKVADGDLPEYRYYVLVSRGTRTDKALYNKYEEKWYSYYDDELDNVTAWCEIPKYKE